MLEHHQVVVDVDGSGRYFSAIGGSAGARFSGSYIEVEDRRLALAVVDAAGAPAHRHVVGART